MKKLIRTLLILLVIIAIAFFGFMPSYIDQTSNAVTLKTDNLPKNITYDSIPFMADLHCDVLLWNRDFFKKHPYGHVDLPRMQEAIITSKINKVLMSFFMI